jgi:hypothetical protein
LLLENAMGWAQAVNFGVLLGRKENQSSHHLPISLGLPPI